MTTSKPICLRPLELTQAAFAPFGRILEPRADEAPEVSAEGSFDFYVLLGVESGGWQIGYLGLQTARLDELECHPRTPEVFSPLRGECALVVSVDGKDPAAFRLSRPIVLNAGVWHGVIRLSGNPTVLIAENNDVADEFVPLERPVVCGEG